MFEKIKEILTKKDKKVDANKEVPLDSKAEVNKEKTTDKKAVKKSNAKTTNKKPKQEEIVEVENTVVESDINNDVKKQSYSGKWKIKRDTDGKYFAELYASNGVKVLKTETYTSLSGVKNGIETIKKNITVGNFATSVDKNGRYCFKLFSKSNRLICVSDYYSSKAKCDGGINSVKRFAETANVIIEEAE